MDRKLSAYWWCQVIGWGSFAVVAGVLYFSGSGISNFPSYSSIFITAGLGLFSSHLMRAFIIRSNILSQKVWVQFPAMFLIAVTFSFIYLLFLLTAEFLRSPATFRNELTGTSVYIGTFRNFNFFIVWIFIYFSYHYIQKSRTQLIETTRLESELKIKQLESEKAQYQYQRNLGNYYLMALRHQMNPHFIFNCINSIKLFIAQNDTISASAYLTKFSKLIRLVMENSSKSKILLASALDTLKLYIDMESMRFKDKLQYAIHVKKDVELDYIELPPLLLQPYVENAIWHGLMPKEAGGRIDIDVEIDNVRSLLKITITDDGIGRKRSEEIRTKTGTKYTSYGMQVTSDRIALINQVYENGADVNIEDLVDIDSNPSGTKVTVQIPV
ncbi:MAG: histidine kinase [Ferruginibacter sp.]